MKMRAFEFVLRRLMIGYRRRQILVKAQLTGQIAEMPLYVADELPYILAPLRILEGKRDIQPVPGLRPHNKRVYTHQHRVTLWRNNMSSFSTFVLSKRSSFKYPPGPSAGPPSSAATFSLGTSSASTMIKARSCESS